MGLISIYQDMNYQDMVLEQLKEVLRCNEAAGRRPGETVPLFQARLLDLRDLVEKKAKDVADRLDKFEVKTAGLSVLPKADMAWQEFGLAGRALEMLLASDVSVFGDKGMMLELELLLHTGRTDEVRRWPDAVKARDLLGSQRYLEIQVLLAAASGDYRQADDDLQESAEEVNRVTAPDGASQIPVRERARRGRRGSADGGPPPGRIPALPVPRDLLLPRDPAPYGQSKPAHHPGSGPADASRPVGPGVGRGRGGEKVLGRRPVDLGR